MVEQRTEMLAARVNQYVNDEQVSLVASEREPRENEMAPSVNTNICTYLLE